MILSAGHTEIFDRAHPIGVGLVSAAIGATKVARTNEPLIFIGSAGSYSKDIAIGSLVFVKKAFQYELRGESPFEQIIEVATPVVSRETIWATCNSSSYITTNQDDSDRFLAMGAQVENMELFSVFSAAKEFGLQALGILYITNYCDIDARADYKKNLPFALEALRIACKEYI